MAAANDSFFFKLEKTYILDCMQGSCMSIIPTAVPILPISRNSMKLYTYYSVSCGASGNQTAPAHIQKILFMSACIHQTCIILTAMISRLRNSAELSSIGEMPTDVRNPITKKSGSQTRNSYISTCIYNPC